MSTPINLNKIRKAAEKARKKQQADENVVRQGRTKAERVAEAARSEAMRAALDRHRIDSDNEP